MKLLKYAASLILCNLVRLVRFFPNNDPIMAFMLPFSRQDKWFHSVIFAFLTMLVFDFFTSGIGVWTFVTAFTYAGIGFAAHLAFKNRVVGLKHYLGAGIAGVLVYDLVTGVFFGPALFGVPMWAAFLAQIPFTLMHLASVSIYIALLCPLLDKRLVFSNAFEDSTVFYSIKNALKSKFFARSN